MILWTEEVLLNNYLYAPPNEEDDQVRSSLNQQQFNRVTKGFTFNKLKRYPSIEVIVNCQEMSPKNKYSHDAWHFSDNV